MKLGSIVFTDNKYRAFFSYQGKRISKRFENKKDALNWLAECQTQYAKGIFIEPNKITTGQWILEYLGTYATNAKPRTMSGYKQTAKILSPIANILMQKVTPYHIQKILNSIKSPSVRPKTYSFMSLLFKKALKLHIIASNPLTAVERPKYHGERKKIFTDTELKAIKTVLPKYKYGNLFLAMLATGCRVGEIQALKITNVHPGYIHIDSTAGVKTAETGTPKTQSSIRDIPIPQTVYKMLVSEWQKNPILKGYIFSSKSGNHLALNNILTVWHKILAEAKVPYRSPHCLRHTHATNLLHQFDYVEVQHRLGHSSASITLNTYGHVKEETTPQILKAVEDMLQ